MRRTVLHIGFAAVLLLAFGSCIKREQPEEGAVTISFSTGQMETKSAADGNDIYLENGNPDLTVLICSGNNIRAAYSNNGAGSAVVGSSTGSLQSISGSTATIRFTNLAQGNYTVYALANTGGLWAMTDGSSPVAASAITAANIESLYFNPVSVPPTVISNRMPLTAKGTLTVNSGHNGTVSLSLNRCVAKVSVYLINNYGSDLTLKSFSCTVKGINPDNGYLISRSPDRFSVSSGNLILADNVNEVQLSAGGTQTYTNLVYPSTASSGYTCDISFSLTNGQGTQPFNWSDLAVTDEYAQRVTSLSRNQQLGITIRIGAGKMVSFNYKVLNWDEDALTQSITFD
jgi:hypothetical protein